MDLNNSITSSKTESTFYYGVCLLNEGDSSPSNDDNVLVFRDKTEALQTVKKNHGARFKAFPSEIDAANFSRNSSCYTPQSTSSSIQDALQLPLSPVVGEKPSAYKAPRSQEMVKLRKAIECGDADFFTKTVWSNPRYLVSCGDTPAILQEGSRYNALHVAAKHNQGALAQHILSILEDKKFLPLMYGDNDEVIIQKRREFIIDLYLNMPEKGICETPLHFACKFGCIKVAEILLAHPSCDIKCLNKYKQTAREIICERNGGNEIKKKIQMLFEATYYVPVLRSEDNSTQAIVGMPYSFTKPQPSEEQTHSPRDPSLVIKAKAGPMPYAKAEEFYRKWQRLRKPPQIVSCNSVQAERQIRLTDSRKGLERIGRALADQLKVSWSEYWSFLDSWYDLESSEGLQKLEAYFREIYQKAINPEEVQDDVHEAVLNDNFDEDTYSPQSPISQLCKKLESIHLDNCYLDTSPDTPAIFGHYSDSELSYDDSNNNCRNPFASPNLRKRQSPYLTLQGSIKNNNSLDSFNIFHSNKSENKAQEKTHNLHLERISNSLSSFLCDSVKSLNDMSTDFISDSVLQCFRIFLKVSHRFISDFLLTFHTCVAEEVVKRLKEDLQPHELVLARNKCNKLNNQDLACVNSSTDEDSDSTQGRNNYRSKRRVKSGFIVRKHLFCILTQVKGLLSEGSDCDFNCDCSWLQTSFPVSGKQVLLKPSLLTEKSEDDSSDEDFFTPPSSCFGSPAPSSVEEPSFTLDETISIFVQGILITKDDLDVQNALERVWVDPILYPHINLWKRSVDSIPKEFVASLLTPVQSQPLHRDYKPSSPSSPQSAPSKVHHMAVGMTPPFKLHGCKTAPSLRVKGMAKPKNFYDCLLNWDEPND